MNTILVVDDSPDYRDFCELVGNLCHLKVEHAENVDHAMWKLEDGCRPDAVLLDLMMPGRPAEDLVQRIRQDRDLDGAKVILVSALREVKDLARKMGADSAIHKPMQMPEFVETLKSLQL